MTTAGPDGLAGRWAKDYNGNDVLTIEYDRLHNGFWVIKAPFTVDDIAFTILTNIEFPRPTNNPTNVPDNQEWFVRLSCDPDTQAAAGHCSGVYHDISAYYNHKEHLFHATQSHSMCKPR